MDVKKYIPVVIIPFVIVVLGLIGYNGYVYYQYLEIVNNNNTSLVESGDNDDLEISITKGKNYAQIKKGLLSYVVTPQFAIWLEDANGDFVQTIYVTPKVESIDRKAALPVWQNRAQVVDTLAGATPKSNSSYGVNLPNQVGTYKVMFEVNISYDSNSYYQLGNDYSGQPSLIYSATITDDQGDYPLSLIGHGSVDGSDGEIYTDLNNITTALQIISSINVKITK